ncbi:diguanylate cyclase [Paenibacillus curdlanolyticus YK9]|uniref:Diguanylate cyclase n=1 Tax=Paenibacillus curdlanolyticus YK9 TaxID=717606 RepID=E0IGC1_9BACL|nr:GGDEF domain-containing protein [Paenibacillus curdlanolyticus]EFM08523.1 diguanylate cyclase [Paenibacillus curdlanolyticus YK9]
MTIVNWLTGQTGIILSSACVIIIVVLMLYMSVKLHQSYRKYKVYGWLIAGLLLAGVQHGIQLFLAAPEANDSPALHLFASILQIESFIIINFVFTKLYTRPSGRLIGPAFISLLAAPFVLTGIQLYLDPDLLKPALDGAGIQVLTLDFYAVLINFLILMDTRGIALNRKFAISLVVYFVYQLARVADGYVFHGASSGLSLMTQFVPLIYFTLLFLMLFEWVIDRMLDIHQSSITDGLTTLYNRKYFNSRCEKWMRERGSVTIIFCDIDNFKRLNDTQGHHAADGVLKKVAEIIKEESGAIGAAGRYGGEELLAVIRGDAKVKAEDVAETIRRRVETETIVTISVGVSTSVSGQSIQEVIKEADEAMYVSKTTGKNKVSVVAKAGRSKTRRSSKAANA